MTNRILHSLGYLGVTSPRASEWPQFAVDLFGMEVTTDADGTQRMRWDDRPFRLTVHPGDQDTIAYIGWETRDGIAFDDALAELTARGATITVEDVEIARARSVHRLASFSDPFGLRHEIFAGAVSYDRTFRGARSTTRFRTGAQGMGHAVLVVPDLAVGVEFYERVLGLRTTDVVHHGGELGTLTFLRCNTRHHSIALWEMPGDRLGLQHIMVESDDTDEVGRAYDVAVTDDRWHISATLGRHVGDEQLSFYVRSPSGFDVELGCDSIEIDDSTWVMRYYDKTAGAHNEVWGHHWQPLGPQSSIHRLNGTT
jgi:extradiol dioxygenase